jgi:hypothetical protein
MPEAKMTRKATAKLKFRAYIAVFLEIDLQF